MEHQQTNDSTIIDIPCEEVESAAAAAAAAAAATATPSATSTTTISMTNLSASTSSLAYDTDSSVASSTCCHRPGEHIYMERHVQQLQQQQYELQQQLQQQLHLQHDDAAVIANKVAASGAISMQHAVVAAAEEDDDEVHFKADQHRKSWPLFICLISLIEITIFVYDLLNARQQRSARSAAASPPPAGSDSVISLVPTDSVFIYRPDRRLEVWRFISYMFLHANWFHLGFNVVVQLFYGVPLEVMHGSLRVAIIYFAGVFAGSLGTSVVDSEVYLVGASGGVYALLAAHLANITLNYGQMRYAVAQLVSVVIFVSCDLGYALYTQYLTAAAIGVDAASVSPTAVPVTASAAPPVSYIAHLTGALAGLTIGLLVLKSFEHRAYENLIWWLALGVYSAFTVFAIVFNLINTVTAQLMEEQGEVITQHLMHDLGVS